MRTWVSSSVVRLLLLVLLLGTVSLVVNLPAVEAEDWVPLPDPGDPGI